MPDHVFEPVAQFAIVLGRPGRAGNLLTVVSCPKILVNRQRFLVLSLRFRRQDVLASRNFKFHALDKKIPFLRSREQRSSWHLNMPGGGVSPAKASIGAVFPAAHRNPPAFLEGMLRVKRGFARALGGLLVLRHDGVADDAIMENL